MTDDREALLAEVGKLTRRQATEDPAAAYALIQRMYAALSAPAAQAPVALPKCADCKLPAACKTVGHCRHGYNAGTQPDGHVFKLLVDRETPAHTTLRLFVNGALAGTLTLRNDEAAAFDKRLKAATPQGVDAAQPDDPIIHAQHDETGRMWTGPQSQLPRRYFRCETPPAPLEAAQPDARDAARYRFLRDEAELSVRDVFGPFCKQLNEGLDAAIDAALAAQEAPSE